MFGELNNPGFRGGVNAVTEAGGQAQYRGDIDDGAATARANHAAGGFGGNYPGTF